MRTTEDIKQSIAGVTAPNAQLAITNELLIDIRTLLMAQLETKQEGQAEVKAESTQLHNVTASNNSWHKRPKSDYYHLNVKGFDEHGDVQMTTFSFSARTRRILDRIDVVFIHQLRHYRRSDILGIYNSGKTTVKEIDEALEKYGIFLPE